MDKQIKESNKLIAEFMGAIFNKEYPTILYPSEHYEVRNVEDLKYHTSWDWIMPVVEKIEDVDRYFTIEKNTAGVSAPYNTNGNEDDDKVGLWFITKVTEADTKIKAVWLAVVEFIKWYNQNK